ncbi:MAG: hypothetical protein KatS3mg105_4305 [Gemmatales bacterium]|nr:MAG: hypothetical protein KatS3mg105_4305 [Gemmatales bacterium]
MSTANASLATIFIPLWGVHIADGILAAPWLLGGFIVAALLLYIGGRQLDEEEIPQIALLTAVFFIVSLIHFRIGASSVHLLFNGLLGVVLGRRAALAIPVGLFLQAALIGHGGFYTLGVNTCVLLLPALAARASMVALGRLPWSRSAGLRFAFVASSCLLWLASVLSSVLLLLYGGLRFPEWVWFAAVPGAIAVSLSVAWCERRFEHAPEFPLGLFVGMVAVVATILLNACVLHWGGQENWSTLATLVFVVHTPIAAIEGMVLGFVVGFLARVKPEMLGFQSPAANVAVAALRENQHERIPSH